MKKNGSDQTETFGFNKEIQRVLAQSPVSSTHSAHYYLESSFNAKRHVNLAVCLTPSVFVFIGH